MHADQHRALEKAKRFLGAARCCYEHGFYDSCASRCYYAVYRAAMVALENAGFRRPHWNHGTLKRKFAEELVRKRELYEEKMNEHLNVCYEQRVIADYTDTWVSSKKAGDVMKRAAEVIERIEGVIAK